ncbi:hypothetical protein M427DRAFT_67038 [Gonapodya prolifera JEL478]|uniref:Uncharacterized protein n=1 Tax=Gonapodya prolifera (strain JEL478) TaxID=1344416 RepID=A0A139ATB5_GONPJ|nr:hypothetical protein M427DRAFT_67038 [Gonapodya prolifera JEL478]|eukprot:KXS19977.1 hypothetical protein M427DRAFT_67038 [Gonapodya prolifera JEL478]
MPIAAHSPPTMLALHLRPIPLRRSHPRTPVGLPHRTRLSFSSSLSSALVAAATQHTHPIPVLIPSPLPASLLSLLSPHSSPVASLLSAPSPVDSLAVQSRRATIETSPTPHG